MILIRVEGQFAREQLGLEILEKKEKLLA